MKNGKGYITWLLPLLGSVKLESHIICCGQESFPPKIQKNKNWNFLPETTRVAEHLVYFKNKVKIFLLGLGSCISFFLFFSLFCSDYPFVPYLFLFSWLIIGHNLVVSLPFCLLCPFVKRLLNMMLSSIKCFRVFLWAGKWTDFMYYTILKLNVMNWIERAFEGKYCTAMSKNNINFTNESSLNWNQKYHEMRIHKENGTK